MSIYYLQTFLRRLCALMLCLGVGTLYAQTPLGGTISTSRTLSKAESPYLVSSSLSITGSLHIPQGVEVQVANGLSIAVNAGGTLLADGATIKPKNAGDSYSISVYQRGKTRFTAADISGLSIMYVYDSCQVKGGTFSSSANGRLFYHNSGLLSLSEDVSLQGGGTYPAIETYGGDLKLQDVRFSNFSFPLQVRGASNLYFSGSITGTSLKQAAIKVESFGIASPVVWGNASAFPYWISSSVQVNTTGSLDIAAGSLLKFDGSGRITAYGPLRAAGTADQPIRFTSIQDDNWGGDTNGDATHTAPAVGNWYGIYLKGSASSLSHVQMRYAGSSSSGALNFSEGDASYVANASLESNYYGLYIVDGAKPSFQQISVGSSTFTPIVLGFDADPSFQDMTYSFSENRYNAIGLLGGTLQRDARLKVRSLGANIPNATYVLLSSLTIPQGRSLQIDAGVVVKAEGYNYYYAHPIALHVQGVLSCMGTAKSPVVFTSIADDNYGGDTNRDGNSTVPVVGHMGGLVFENRSQPSSLSHTHICYAALMNGYSVQWREEEPHYQEAVFVKGGSHRFQSCHIRFVNTAFNILFDAAPTLDSISFSNTASVPFYMSSSATPTIGHATLENVGVTAIGLSAGRLSIDGRILSMPFAGYENIPYLLTTTLRVMPNVRLSVAPGVCIKASGQGRVFVEGALQVDGQADKKVVFTSVADDSYGTPADTNGDGGSTQPKDHPWYGIHFAPSSNDTLSFVRHAHLRYTHYYAPLTAEDASPLWEDLRVSESSVQGLVFLQGAAPTVRRVSIEQCAASPIGMSMLANPQFSDVQFLSNANSGIELLDNKITSDAVLYKRAMAGFENVPYILYDKRISFDNQALLTIKAGVIIKAGYSYYYYDQPGFSFLNGARLQVEGTAQEKVAFTILADDAHGGDTNNNGNASVPQYGQGMGLYFENTQGSQITHLIHKYPRQVAVSLKSASAHISDSEFALSQYNALTIEGTSAPSFRRVKFSNIDNAPVRMGLFTRPVFEDISLSNVKYHGLFIMSETYAQSDTVPVRAFAGYNPATYIMQGSEIAYGTHLVVPKGLTFKQWGGYPIFTVKGRLSVQGTQEQSVVFTDMYDDRYGQPADLAQDGPNGRPSWSSTHALSFENSASDSSLVSHAVFAYGSPAVTQVSASPAFQSVSFTDGHDAIVLRETSRARIKDSRFSILGMPIKMSLAADIDQDENNKLEGNTIRGLGIIDNETLVKDDTLTKRSFAGVNAIPYVFPSYTIGTGVNLHIEPGVVVKFWSGAKMTVNGKLTAIGKAESKIVFTALSDDYYGGKTYLHTQYGTHDFWGGLSFTNQSDDESALQHAVLSKGYAGEYYPLLDLQSSSPRFSHLLFSDAGLGMKVSGSSNPKLNHSDFVRVKKGIENTDKTFTIDATQNWWGERTGPNHAANPDGTGASVSDGVNYTPWRTDFQVNPITGDVSRNGQVTSYDAALLLRANVGLETLTTQQDSLADVSADGGATAMDASYILQYTSGILSSFPKESTNRRLSLPATSASWAWDSSISESLSEGQELQLTLSLQQAANSYALQTVLTAKHFQLLEAKLSEQAKKAGVLAHIKDNTLRLAFASDSPKDLSGEMLTLRLKVNQLPLPANLSLQVADARVNDQPIALAQPEWKLQGADDRMLKVFPVPATAASQLSFQVEQRAAKVQLQVYNLLGQRVATLVDGKEHAAGYHQLPFNTQQLGLRKGVYLLKYTVGERTETLRVLVQE